MERYERLKILGVGSFGKVYLMRHRQERRLVCAKIIRIRNLSRKEKDACRTEVRIQLLQPRSEQRMSTLGAIEIFKTLGVTKEFAAD